jgi:hypothetical protein
MNIVFLWATPQKTPFFWCFFQKKKSACSHVGFSKIALFSRFFQIGRVFGPKKKMF